MQKLNAALELAKAGATWEAVDALAEVWGETRDPQLGATVAELGDALAVCDRSYLPLEVRRRTLDGPTLELVLGNVDAMQPYESSGEWLLEPLQRALDPRAAQLGLRVFANDSARKQLRAAAGELIVNNLDAGFHARLRALADSILPVLKPSVVALLERCVLPATKPLDAEQFRTVDEVRRLVLGDLVAARARVLAAVHAGQAEPDDATDDDEAAARDDAAWQQRREAAQAMRASLAASIDRASVQIRQPDHPGFPPVLEAKVRERKHGRWGLDELDAADVGDLVARGFVRLDSAPDGRPSAAAMLAMLRRWPQLRCAGWVRPPPAVDGAIDGLYGENDLTPALVADFATFSGDLGPDDVDLDLEERLRAWWD